VASLATVRSSEILFAMELVLRLALIFNLQSEELAEELLAGSL
jgi:hypothetical protein